MARKQGSHGPATELTLRKHAIQLIAKHGYAAMSLRQLASESNLQSGSLYHYFSSKQELLSTLLTDNMTQLLNEWDQVKPSNTDAITQLKTFVKFHIQYHTKNKLEAFISDMELRSLEPESKKTVIALRKQYENELSTILDNGMKQGHFHISENRAITYAILSMLTGVYIWYSEKGRLSESELIDLYSDLVLKSIS